VGRRSGVGVAVAKPSVKKTNKDWGNGNARSFIKCLHLSPDQVNERAADDVVSS